MALVADNVGMNKFKSTMDMNYRLVVGQLTRMVDQIEKGAQRSRHADM